MRKVKTAIEPIMTHVEAYAVLNQANYQRVLYPETSKIIQDAMDDDNECIRISPKELAAQLDGADKDRTVPEDIFSFIEKAYHDAYEHIDDRYALPLGRIYYYDHYAHVDYKKAVKYFTLGAESGSGQAEVFLGICYYRGIGVKTDYEKAFHLLVKGALEGESAEAMMLVGCMYLNGQYVKKDKAEGFDLLRHALRIAEKDDRTDLCVAEIYLELGGCYLQRDSMADLALTCFQKAEGYFYDQEKRQYHTAPAGVQKAIAGQERARKLMHTKKTSVKTYPAVDMKHYS